MEGIWSVCLMVFDVIKVVFDESICILFLY